MTRPSPPLYRSLLGPAFDRLPAKVRELHTVHGRTIWVGEADVSRGASRLARFGGWLAGLPPAGRAVPVTVTFTAERGGETWHRSFGGKTFISHQRAHYDRIIERAGLVTLTMRPSVVDGHLELTLLAMRILGVSVPAPLRPVIRTREFEHQHRYMFDVEASLPRFGLIIRYNGWLMPSTGTSPSPQE